ncbi:MAG: hypothetical protein K2H34_00365 [Lachnospiraceae bacterium]|nr:hypothetical protein [Lachnospiraceae bacterium]
MKKNGKMSRMKDRQRNNSDVNLSGGRTEEGAYSLRAGIGRMKSPVWIIVLAVALFLLVEYMPEAIAAVFESRNLNQYQTSKHIAASDEVRFSLSTAEKMQVLSANDLRMSQLFSITAESELNAQAPDLLNKVKGELKKWREANLIFGKNEDIDALDFQSAEYYTICNAENTNLTVNAWLLQLTSDGSPIKIFIDAESYMIYGLSLPNTGVSDYLKRLREGLYAENEHVNEGQTGRKELDSYGVDRDRLLEYWADQYAEQLRRYYAADDLGSSYVLSECNIVDFAIFYYTAENERIKVPYYVTLNADVANIEENSKKMCVSVFRLIESFFPIYTPEKDDLSDNFSYGS